MYYVYRKRITRIEIPNTTESAKEVLELAKKVAYSGDEKLISDSFFVEDQADGKGLILAKEKVISVATIPAELDPTIGKTFATG